MTEHPQHSGSSNWARKEAQKENMKTSERAGEIAAIIGIILTSLFFYTHQAWSTGFFTSAFGATEAFFLYGSILVGMAGPIARLMTGRRNISRLPELAASVFLIVGSAWLFIVFPFNFAHLADTVPEFLQFLVKWVTNDIAKVLFVIGIAGGIIFIAVNAILYRQVRKVLQTQRAG